MIRPFTVLCFCAFAGAGAWLYQVKHQVAQLDRELRDINRQTEQAWDRISILRAEWALLNEPGRLKQVAQQHLSLEPMQPQHFARLTEIERRLPGAVAFAGAPSLFDSPPAATQPGTAQVMLAAAQVPAPAARATADARAPERRTAEARTTETRTADARPAAAQATDSRASEAPAPQALAAAIAVQRERAASQPIARPAPAPAPRMAAPAPSAAPVAAPRPTVMPAMHVAPAPVTRAAPVTRVTQSRTAAPETGVASSLGVPSALGGASSLGGSALGRALLAPPVPVAAAATLDGTLRPPAR